MTSLTGEGGAVLGLDEDALAACVNCGLCLPHCPTFRVTGEESASPRGRINAMRGVEAHVAEPDGAFVGYMEACVQCRACESVCPSSVPFGELMEDTRSALVRSESGRRSSVRGVLQQLGLWLLGRHRLLAFASVILSWAQRIPGVGSRLGVPRISVGVRAGGRRDSSTPAGELRPDVWLFDGCVMDLWFRPIQEASRQLIEATGARVARPGRGSDCCGALHVHAGRPDGARRLARRVIRSMPGDAPILVDSAGCGAALKDYGRLLGTPAAKRFALRVRDLSEFLDGSDMDVRHTGRTVVLQEPCHLRFVQGLEGAWRSLLGRAYTVRETADDGLCCGAGGMYSVLQPALSGEILERKVSAIRAVAPGGPGASTDRSVVASANPGCILQLRTAGLEVAHPSVLMAAALGEADRDNGPVSTERRAQQRRSRDGRSQHGGENGGS